MNVYILRYELTSICDSAQACVSALLGDPIAPVSSEEASLAPVPVAVDLLNRVIAIHCKLSPILPVNIC